MMREYHNEFAELWHNVPGALEKAGGLWLVRAGRNRAKPLYATGPKLIQAYGFHVIVEGGIRLADENQEVELHKDDVFCLFPGISYTYRKVAPEVPLRMVWLTLDGPQMEPLLTALGITRSKPYRRKAVHPKARIALRHLEESLWERGSLENALARTGLLYRWFNQLASAEPGDPADGWRTDEHGEWLKKAVAFFRLHYAEPQLRVESVARMAGIHRSHFTQTFTDRMGMPPQRFLAELRMERAEQLLRSSQPGIGEVALSVGYADLYTFSRAFKKRFGVSPTEYRNRKMSIAVECVDTL